MTAQGNHFILSSLKLPAICIAPILTYLHGSIIYQMKIPTAPIPIIKNAHDVIKSKTIKNIQSMKFTPPFYAFIFFSTVPPQPSIIPYTSYYPAHIRIFPQVQLLSSLYPSKNIIAYKSHIPPKIPTCLQILYF